MNQTDAETGTLSDRMDALVHHRDLPRPGGENGGEAVTVSK
jgi:hypothetical protein